MAGNVDKMRRADLMKYAASLGVATRREGGRNWRQVDEVRAQCEIKLAQRASTLDVPSFSEEVSEFDGLLRDDLRAQAQSLGVTTHVGSKWRTAAELRRACGERQKLSTLCQRRNQCRLSMKQSIKKFPSLTACGEMI